MATWAVLREVADGDASALVVGRGPLQGPGLSRAGLRTDLWRDGTTIRFRSYADADTLVLDSGHIELREGEARPVSPITDDSPDILYDVADNGVATITFNRPQQLNALTTDDGSPRRLPQLCAAAGADPARQGRRDHRHGTRILHRR